jgi:hypothetical protein
VTPPRVFQDRNSCIPKYSDVIEIYGQVLWLPVYLTPFLIVFLLSFILGYRMEIVSMILASVPSHEQVVTHAPIRCNRTGAKL